MSLIGSTKEIRIEEDTFQLTFVHQIRDGAYVCVRADSGIDVDIVVVFAGYSRRMLMIVCNLGKFKCDQDFIVGFTDIDPVPYPVFDTNSKLFSINFADRIYSMYKVEGQQAVFTPEIEAYNNLFNQIYSMHSTMIIGEPNFKTNPHPIKKINEFQTNQTDRENLIKRFYFNRHVEPVPDAFKNFLDQYPTYQFMKAQYDFLNGLSIDKIKLLKLYSHNGDVLINKYIRDKFQITDDLIEYYADHEEILQEYYDTDDVEAFLQHFYREMTDLLKNAPKVDRDFVLYRGSRTVEYFYGAVDGIYLNSGFISTTLDPDIALEFADENYMHEIIVPKGTPLVYNAYTRYPSEIELILSDKTYFLITKPFQSRIYVDPNEWYMNKLIDVKTNQLILLND